MNGFVSFVVFIQNVARAENSMQGVQCWILNAVQGLVFCSGKTSLLLQFAYNCARQDSSSFVTFLCKPHSFDDNPPCLSQVRFLLLKLNDNNFSLVSLQ